MVTLPDMWRGRSRCESMISFLLMHDDIIVCLKLNYVCHNKNKRHYMCNLFALRQLSGNVWD